MRRPCTGLIALGLALNLNAGAAAMADVVAVVAADSPVSALTKNEIADIFLGRRKRFPNGEPAVPIDQSEGSASRDEFYRAFTDKLPAQLAEHWSRVLFTGRGKPPKAVPDGVAARKAVAANPQAIAYLDRKLVDSSVKVLQPR